MWRRYVITALAQLVTGVDRLRAVRTRFKLDGLVDIHHIIPRQHARRMPADMLHAAENVMLMPTLDGVARMRLRPTRLIHHGGHVSYNAYVGARLASIAIDDRAALLALQRDLRRRIRLDDPELPWY
jgi:hypothetical protein